MVISAPTGSGKTVLFELCILRLLSRFISEEGRFIHSKGTLKTVSPQDMSTILDIYLRTLVDTGQRNFFNLDFEEDCNTFSKYPFYLSACSHHDLGTDTALVI